MKFEPGLIDRDQVHPSVSIEIGERNRDIPDVGEHSVVDDLGEYRIETSKLVAPWGNIDQLFSVTRIEGGNVVAAWGFLSYEDAKRFLLERGPRRFVVNPVTGDEEIRHCLGADVTIKPYEITQS